MKNEEVNQETIPIVGDMVSKRPRKRPVRAKPNGHVKANGARANTIKLDQFGFRVGSLKAKAAAMYSRERGATLAEVTDKLDSVQFNVLTTAKGRGHKVRSSKEDSKDGRVRTRYFLIAK